MKRLFYSIGMFAFIFFGIQTLQAQTNVSQDSISSKLLDSIVISASTRLNHVSYMKPVEGMTIYAGKKTNTILLDPAKSNLAANISRTLLSQIPGITIWDMSGSGAQLNIGSRGTDAHRSIEMNMRQNGYNINSDVFGYPEAHYTPAMQGVQRIELVRGSAALQFGPQYGGMLNYVMKEGDSAKAFTLESKQTLGSFNFFNSFNAMGGKKGRWRYYGYYDFRRGDGWRPNSAFIYQNYYANIQYNFLSRGSIALQFSGMKYREQIAGGLTDGQFQQDSRTSLRSRNFFSPQIYIPALTFNYPFSEATKLQVIAHYLIGQRNSVQFLNPPNIADTVNNQLGTYNPRQVDRDYYSGFTTEARVTHTYSLGKSTNNTLAAGLRFFKQTTRRKQKGLGTAGSDFDLSLVKDYGINLGLHSVNYAAFAENLFQVSKRFSITPGVRYELLDTKLDGVISNAAVPLSYSSHRSFPLLGTGIQYLVSKRTELYGNMSQAYRPFLYSNVTPADRIDIVDPNLKDSKGYDIDFGYRGNVAEILKFDINGFYLLYGNRVGQLTLKDQNGTNYLYTTNIGDAVSKGIEAYVSISFARLLMPQYAGNLYKLRLYNSFSYTHARYLDATINKNGVNTSLKGNAVEGTPEWTNRTGLAWQHKTFVTQLTFTYVGKSYSDANNTIFNATGATGIVPSYQLWDISFDWQLLNHYSLSGGINNISNASYFSRRINMYPGPGILPGDGRSFYLTLGIKL